LQTGLYILGAVFALGIMVMLHEFGHFLVARFFGVRVDVFSIGFGPRLLGVKRGPTDYRLSALPFGGYVRMAGDNPSEERTGAPDEFLSKPRWQRVCIALAGPTMNMLTAICILTVHFMGNNPPTPVFYESPISVAWVAPGSPADHAGIKSGDKLIAINGADSPTWKRAHWETFFSVPGLSIPITIERNGQTVTTSVRSTMDEGKMFGYPYEPSLVDAVNPGEPAEKAGLRAGDQIISIDGQEIQSPGQFKEIVNQHQDKPSHLEVLRGGHKIPILVSGLWKDPGDGGGPRWMLGFQFRSDLQVTHTGIVEAAGFSVWFNYRLAGQIVESLGQLFQRKLSAKDFMGPVGIITLSGRTARTGIRNLSFLMAIISLNLGVLNLLPIPILDGGHILMLGVEGLIRKDLSLKTKERFIQVGLVFLLVIFAFVMYNDVVRLIPHS
jgi:regulator of sigma E protease